MPSACSRAKEKMGHQAAGTRNTTFSTSHVAKLTSWANVMGQRLPQSHCRHIMLLYSPFWPMPSNDWGLTGWLTPSMTGVPALEVPSGTRSSSRAHIGTDLLRRAASNIFQNDASVANDFATMPERRIAGSTLTKYVAMERRQGLAAMGQRLLRGIFSIYSGDGPCLYSCRRQIGWNLD